MIDWTSKKFKIAWSEKLFKKRLNIESKSEQFEADDSMYRGIDEEWRKNSSRSEACTVKKSETVSISDSIKTSSRWNCDGVRRSKINLDASRIRDVHHYKIFVATWNVAGKSPPDYLNIQEWLRTSPPADIYVLGFQEIVPLNAGNVLGTEDNGPAKKWLSLIKKTLNSLPGNCGGYQTPSPFPDPIVESNADSDGLSGQKGSSFLNHHSFWRMSRRMRMAKDDNSVPLSQLDKKFSDLNQVIAGHRLSDYDLNIGLGCSLDDENGPDTLLNTHSSDRGSFSMDGREGQTRRSLYCLVASKQMVGIFLTLWIRSDLQEAVHNLKVSCVGRGLMGYLGNKGSISISMSLHQTSFCFICSHLTSGEKDGDQLRRNSDVVEILRKTRFPRVHSARDENSPRTVLEHDQIIWLGDLNYRIALSYTCVKALVEDCNWRALLENDQLRIEKKRGRVFVGWNEGKIYFPPTYKYLDNSDRYAGDDMHPKEKRRTPAWCDRILWYGQGLHQLSYVRGESRFSDHRPVYSTFLAEVESANSNQVKKSRSFSSSRIEVEELLTQLHG